MVPRRKAGSRRVDISDHLRPVANQSAIKVVDAPAANLGSRKTVLRNRRGQLMAVRLRAAGRSLKAASAPAAAAAPDVEEARRYRITPISYRRLILCP